MSIHKSLLTVLALAGVASGAKCPGYWDIANHTTMSMFDMKAFEAVPNWYEMHSHDIPVATTGCNCVRYHQTPNNDGTYSDVFNCRKESPKNPHITMFNSTLFPNRNASEAGKMTEAVIGNDATAYWVLDQDQNYNFTLVYACVQTLPEEKDDFIYFFSSTPQFPAELYARWSGYLSSKGAQMDKVIKINQEGCW
eukprot:TRINITY_DN1175_c1_g1_i2.p1 TRINITY_DN1175_c1_g1~~TRINITY_DN1175_c1_g1_i2.p1  ORF type:complete len:214 (+),score=56.45 TRINITY_DN1175_c1_g1_i2:60-644(+)